MSDEPPIIRLLKPWVDNPQRLARHHYIVQAVAAVVFFVLAYVAGGVQVGTLVLQGKHTSGTIVGYEKAQITSRSSSGSSSSRTANMPVVAFYAEGEIVRFRDHWGSSRHLPINGEKVYVLYEPGNPSHAMIDKRLRNWIPWGPCLAIGLFLVLVALRGWLASRGA